MIVGILMSLLVILLSTAWIGLGQPSADTMTRCRLLQEAQMATLSLTEDLGGSMPVKTSTSQTFDPPQANTDGAILDVTTTDGTQLNIVLPTGTIVYRLSTAGDGLGANRLLRDDGTKKFVVADYEKALAKIH